MQNVSWQFQLQIKLPTLDVAGCILHFTQWVSNIEFQDIQVIFTNLEWSVWGHMRANLVGFHDTEQLSSLILGYHLLIKALYYTYTTYRKETNIQNTY